MTIRSIRAIAACAALTAATPDAGAQQPRPVSLDVSIGAAQGLGGGLRRYRGLFAPDALLLVRAHRARSFVAGADAGLQYMGYADLSCLIPPGGGDCVPDFPGLGYVGALGGWESGGGNLRALAGPALAFVWEDHHSQVRTAALLGRVDLASPQLGPFALTASLRGLLLGHRFQGEAAGTWAMGVGIRLR